MRTAALLILSLVLLAACQEQTISEQKNHVTEALPQIAISTADQLYMDRESGEPADGEYTSTHEDGTPRASLIFSDGLIPEGTIHERPEGFYESVDKDSQIEWTFTKDNGVYLCTLTVDGVKRQQTGHGDRLTDVVRMRIWSPDGTPIAEFSEYRMKEWFPNGELKSVAEFDPDGSGLHGRVAAWYQDGQISGESFYSNDLLNGHYREWDEEGNLITERYCKDGEPVAAQRE